MTYNNYHVINIAHSNSRDTLLYDSVTTRVPAAACFVTLEQLRRISVVEVRIENASVSVPASDTGSHTGTGGSGTISLTCTTLQSTQNTQSKRQLYIRRLK